MSIQEKRTSIASSLLDLSAAISKAGFEPAFVLLKGKRPFQKGWLELRPSIEEIIAHINQADSHSVGIQPASLGCVVLDCDEGEGPFVVEDAFPNAHAATTPSSSGAPNKGHVWLRCEDPQAVGNGKFKLSDPIDGEASGDFRTIGGQVRLTPDAARKLSRAINDGRMTKGKKLPVNDLMAIWTCHGLVPCP